MDSRGGRGILLGQIASNISLVWSQENDKIQRVADGHIEDNVVSLNEGAADRAKISSMDEMADPNPGGHQEGVELHPARGFAAYVAVSSSSERIPHSYSDAM